MSEFEITLRPSSLLPSFLAMETEAKGIEVSGWVTGMPLTPASLGQFLLDYFVLCASEGSEFRVREQSWS